VHFCLCTASAVVAAPSSPKHPTEVSRRPQGFVEITMPEVPRFARFSRCVLDALSWSQERSGLPGAKATLMAQGDAIAGATADGTPSTIALKQFGHFNEAIKRDGPRPLPGRWRAALLSIGRALGIATQTTNTS
jgi:hypothetical protein